MRRVLAIALATAGAATACGGEEADPPPEPDAASNPFSCQPPGDSQGQEIPLAVGLSANGVFSEFADGDTCPLVLGYQGFLMMVVELRASMPIAAEGICLDCVTTVSPAGSFPGTTQQAYTQFRVQPDETFRGVSSIVLGDKAQLLDLESAEADLAVECEGHGVAGNIARTLELDVPD